LERLNVFSLGENLHHQERFIMSVNSPAYVPASKQSAHVSFGVKKSKKARAKPKDRFEKSQTQVAPKEDNPSPSSTTEKTIQKTQREQLLESLEFWKQKLPKELQVNLPVDVLDDAQLEDECKALSGLYGLRHGKNWKQTRSALEDFLAMTGPNVTNQSCGSISITHALRLGTGMLASASRHKDSNIALNARGDKPIIETRAYLAARPEERVQMEDALHRKLLEQFDIDKGGIKAAKDIRTVEKRLLNAGNGSQALIFERKRFNDGDDIGHVTLAVNIRGQIFHIDNTPFRSAVVSPLRAMSFWLQRQFLENYPNYELSRPLPTNLGNYWYGILNTRVMDYITSGDPLEVPSLPSLPVRPTPSRLALFMQGVTLLIKSILPNFSSWFKN
jgi:hypothetical protein